MNVVVRWLVRLGILACVSGVAWLFGWAVANLAVAGWMAAIMATAAFPYVLMIDHD
ncbi:hypothetical protein [Pleomorphomonas oryzae]|uniref:hypothetical protein n=1 Tax=Pleomorphomonas oryzae TaxID=261934 RepID=UPI00042043B2|nr:hypothetical protein [Pleomorphomonas oryzae]